VDDLRNRVRGSGLPELPWSEVARAPRGPILAFACAGKDAIAWWNTLRPHASTIGYPILLGTDEDVNRLREALGYAVRERGVVDPVDPQAWFKGRASELVDGLEPDERADFETSIHGPWPSLSPSTSFLIPIDRRKNKPHERIWIAVVHVAYPWEAASAIEFGAWNACPTPEEHVAVMRYWSERWGAEPVGIAADTVEMLVARPPTSRDDALALANEQLAYCEDIVTQGVGTVEALAATLVDGKTWFFWWD
jgi:hypothetical protein